MQRVVLLLPLQVLLVLRMTVTGDSGSEDINLLTETFSFTGGANVTSTAASNGVSVALDSEHFSDLTSVTLVLLPLSLVLSLVM